MSQDMRSFNARLETFQQPHKLSKRRASSQTKKKTATTAEWPHEHPAPDELARAGFFYRPASDDLDNVQCFCCTVKLNGWEPNDNAIREHIAHSQSCAWALAISVSREDGEMEESRDPMSDELLDARRATFDTGDGWPHEGKRGWKCKVEKMIEAGWVFDPNSEAEDGVTCFYCNISLDGWEPKDDPFEEHRKRAEECPFFTLVKQYHGDFKTAKVKGKGRSKSRTSTTSKASRMSTQSTVSLAVSEAASLSDDGDETAEVDDSVVTTGTVSSQAAGKKRKTTTKAKGGAKSSKGRKKAETIEPQAATEVQYPCLGGNADHSHQSEEAIPTTRSPLSRSKQPASKGGKKAKRHDQPAVDVPETKNTFYEPHTSNKPNGPRTSDASSQLQDELEYSIDYESPDDEATPHAKTSALKRGIKRMSDGSPKEHQSSIMAFEFPVPPQADPDSAARKSQKPKYYAADQQTDANWQSFADSEASAASQLSPELADPSKAKKGAPKKGRGKKASSTRSSKASATDQEPDAAAQLAEDLAKDEEEIEQELARIAAEQRAHVMEVEQDKVMEYEPSPSQRHSLKVTELRVLQDEVDAENQPAYSSPMQTLVFEKKAFTPSPSGSDKENHPSSRILPSAGKPAPNSLMLSPTKTTRIALAPSTPNRASPAKRLAQISPAKQQLQHLTSAVPWSEIDLDSVLLSSMEPTPGRVGQQLARAAGVLGAEERGMSVETWIRWRADLSEKDMRRKCEELVGIFEREGVQALACLEGLDVVG